MELLPPDIRAQIPPVRWEDENLDLVACVKFYIPGVNWAWYVTGVDDGDVCYGLVRGTHEEVGYFNLSMVKQTAEKLGRKVKRDTNFKPMSILQLRRKIPIGTTDYKGAQVRIYIDQADAMKQQGRDIPLEQLAQNIKALMPDDPESFNSLVGYDYPGLSEYLYFLFSGDSDTGKPLSQKMYQAIIKKLAVIAVSNNFKKLWLELIQIEGDSNLLVATDLEIELYGTTLQEWKDAHPGNSEPPLRPRYQLISQYAQEF